MKKILFLGLIGIIILFILISCIDDFSDYLTKNFTFESDLVSCYNERSEYTGLQEFDPSEGIVIIIILII